MSNFNKDNPWKSRIKNLSAEQSDQNCNNVNKQLTHNSVNSLVITAMTNNTQDMLTRTPSLEKARIILKLTSSNSISITPSSKPLSILLTKFSNDKVNYDLSTKQWNVAIDFYEKVISELKKGFKFQEIPRGVIEALKRSSHMTQTDFKLDQNLMNQLLPFQKKGVLFGLTRNGRVLLADEMGLGKTYQALAIASFYELEWPLLIIAPASLLENWRGMITNLLKLKSVIIRKGTDFGENISIISYDMASKHIESINMKKFMVVICDECHYLKCSQTKRTSNILPVLQKATRLILISGTPALSRPIELYTILMALDKRLFKSMSEYGYRYCNLKRINNYFDWKGATNLDELFCFLKECFMIRRTKNEVLNQLPPKSRRQVILQISKSDREMLKAHNEILEKIKNDNIDDTIIERYREASVLKINPVIEYLKSIIEKEHKFIVFAHHQTMLDAIEKILKGGKYIRIDGKTPTSGRQTLVDKYQSDTSIQVALLSLTACNTGLTLTAARSVVFAELYWNPGTMLQAEDRAHRIGQKENVDIHYLTALGTVDEYVWPVLIKKLTVLEKMGVGNNNLKGMVNVESSQKNLMDFNIKTRKK